MENIKEEIIDSIHYNIKGSLVCRMGQDIKDISILNPIISVYSINIKNIRFSYFNTKDTG